MESSKLLEAAKRITRENPEMFDALLEFERTKKLPRTSYRQRINLTIDSALLRKFKQYCRENSLNMIEKHIKEELNQQ